MYWHSTYFFVYYSCILFFVLLFTVHLCAIDTRFNKCNLSCCISANREDTIRKLVNSRIVINSWTGLTKIKREIWLSFLNANKLIWLSCRHTDLVSYLHAWHVAGNTTWKPANLSAYCLCVLTLDLSPSTCCQSTSGSTVSPFRAILY